MNRALIHITDIEDPRISAYRDIRERDLVGRQGRFIAEGRTVLNVLFSHSRFTADSVFLRSSRIAGSEELLSRIPAHVPVYVAEAEVMDQIAGFHMHRGILAIGQRQNIPDIHNVIDPASDQALVVALAGIANHDNMGSIFRNAAAFGADAVVMDSSCCDPLYRKSIRVSVGAVLKVPFAKAHSASIMVDTLLAQGFDIYALSPQGCEDIAAIKPGKKTALLLGSEGTGLPPALMNQLRTVRIGMEQDFDSLNVAAASAIALHRMWRDQKH